MVDTHGTVSDAAISSNLDVRPSLYARVSSTRAQEHTRDLRLFLAATTSGSMSGRCGEDVERRRL